MPSELFDDLPDAQPASNTALFDDLPSLEPESVSVGRGLKGALARGIKTMFEVPAVAAATGATVKPPTARQERQAFESAMGDPRYMQSLIESYDDPRRMAKAESFFGPGQKLEEIRAKDNAIRDVWAGVVAEFEQEKGKTDKTAPQIALGQAQTPLEKWNVFRKNPVQLLATIALESLPPSLAGGFIGTLTAGPGSGTALGVGMSSYATTLSAELLGEASKKGYKLDDADSLSKFLSNEKDFNEAYGVAAAKAGPVGAIDAATAGAAGRFIEPALKQGLRSVLKASGKELAQQAVGGSGGELLGQTLSGQPIDWFDIGMEGLAEVFSGPAEAISNVRQSLGQQTQTGTTPAVVPTIERKTDALPVSETKKLDVPPQAPPSPQVVEEVRQPAAPKEESKRDVQRPQVLTDNLYVTVNAPQELAPGTVVPGYVQIDEVVGGKNTRSGMAKVMQEAGITVPDFSKLPQGQYTYAQAVEMLSQGATRSPQEERSVEGLTSPISAASPVESKAVPKATKTVDATTEHNWLTVPEPDVEGAKAQAKEAATRISDLQKQLDEITKERKTIEGEILNKRGRSWERGQIKKSANKQLVARYHQLGNRSRELHVMAQEIRDSNREAADTAEQASMRRIVNDKSQPMLRRVAMRKMLWLSESKGKPVPSDLGKLLDAETEAEIKRRFPDATKEEIKRLSFATERAALGMADIEGSFRLDPELQLYRQRLGEIEAAYHEYEMGNNYASDFSEGLKSEIYKYIPRIRPYGHPDKATAPQNPTATTLPELKKRMEAEAEKIFKERKARDEAAAKAEAELEAKFTKSIKTETASDAKAAKVILIRELEKALEEAPETPAGKAKVTIEIPGDGTFRVFNDKKSLADVLQRAKGLSTATSSKGYTENLPTAEKRKEYLEEARKLAQTYSSEPATSTTRDASYDSVIAASNGDGKTVLEHIAKNSKSEWYRKVAQKLIDAGINPRIRLMPYAQALAEYPDIPTESYEGKLPTGIYDLNLDMVIVYAESPNVEKTVLHEMLHAGTVHGLINDDKFLFEMRRLFNLANKPEAAGKYGLTNEYEFVAEAWTNPEFQNYLKTVKDGARTLWQRFTDLLRRLFGLEPKDTVLESVLKGTQFEPSQAIQSDAPITFQSLVESGVEAERALIRSVSRGVPAQAAERALIGAQIAKPLEFIVNKIGPLTDPATIKAAAQMGVSDLLDIDTVLGAPSNDYEALKAANPDTEYLQQAALEAAVRYQVFKDRLSKVDPQSPAYATAQSILTDPEFTRYENIVNRDAGVESRPDQWKKLYYGEVEGKITIPLPTGTSVEVSLMGDQAAFAAERVKLENAYNDWLAWKAAQDALPDDQRSPYYQFHVNHMRWMEEVLLTSRVTNPPSLVTPSNLSGRDIGAWDMVKYLVDDLATRVGGALRVTAENFTLIRKFAQNLQQKHHSTYARAMIEAAKSMGFKGSTQEAVVQLYDEVMRPLFALAQNPEFQVFPGKLVGKGYAITKEVIRALRLQSKITSEGFDIVQYKVPQRRPGLAFTPIIEDTFMGTQWFGRSLKTNANTLTWHGFNQRALDFVASFIANKDPAVRSAKLEGNYDLAISYITNRQSVLRFGQSPYENAYKVVGEQLQAEFAAGTLNPAQQNLSEIVNRVAATGVSAPDVRPQMEEELTGLLTAFHNRMGEPDPTVNLRAASETNSFTARRHDQSFPDYFNQYGWRTSVDFLSFIHRIHSYAFETMANGMAQAMQDLQRQRAEFTAQYQQRAKSLGISEDKAKQQVLSQNRLDLLNGTTYDRFDSIDKKIRLLQRNIDGMMSIYGRKGRTEDMDFRTLMRMSRFVIGGILTGLSTTIRNGLGVVYLGKTVGALRRNAITGSFDAAWHIMWDGLVKHSGSLALSAAKAAIVGPVEGIRKGSVGAGYAAALKSIVEGTYRRLDTYGQLDADGTISSTNALGDFRTRLAMPATSGLIVDEDRGIINRTVLGTLGLFDAFLLTGFAKHLFPKLGDSIINSAGMKAAQGVIQHHEQRLRNLYRIWKANGQLNTRFDLSNPNNPQNRLTVQEVFPAWILGGRSRQKLAMLEQYFEGAGTTLQQAAIRFFQQLEAGNQNATLLDERQTTGFIEQLLNEINIATAANRPWWTVKHGLYSLISPLMGWNLSTLRGFFKTFSRPGVAPNSSRAMLWSTVLLSVIPLLLLLNIGQGLGVEELLRLISKHVTGMERATRLPWEHDTDKKKALSLLLYSIDPVPFMASAASFALSDMPNRANADLTPVLLAKTKDLLSYVGGVIQTGDATYGLTRLAKSFFPIAEPLINRMQEGQTEALAARRLLTRFGPSELIQDRKTAPSATGTPLSPIVGRMLEASMEGNDAEFMRQYGLAVETARKMGKANPEQAVRQAFQSRNPYSRAFKQQLEPEQRAELLNRLNPEQRALLEGVENKFRHSVGLLGGTANFARQVNGSRQGVNLSGNRVGRVAGVRRPRLSAGRLSRSRRRIGRGRLSRGLSARRRSRRRGLRRGLRV